jgi:hypothetical protein
VCPVTCSPYRATLSQLVVQSPSTELSGLVVAVLGPETMASCSIDGVLLDVPLPSDLNATSSHISQIENFKVVPFSDALKPREPTCK